MISRAPQGTARRGARVAGRALATLTTPLLPDDYLGLINPLWSTRELRGRVVATRTVGPASTELTVRPGAGAVDHVPGQHVGIGVELGGRWHWRTYSPTSAPGRPLTITVTAVGDGSVSPYLAHVARAGDVLRLGPPAGEFTLGASSGPLLFITGGSGITPVLGMLRSLVGQPRDVVVVHNGRDELVHRDDLREIARHPWLRLIERRTAREGRLTPADLRSLVPDWRERTAYVCGPTGLVDTVVAHHEAAGLPVHHERFAPPTPPSTVGTGTGGTVTFSGRGIRASAVAGPATPLLIAGEDAGALLPSGCRMGICRTCVGHLAAGAVHDLQTGERHEAGPDQIVRTCVSAAAGDVHIDYP